MKTRPDKSRVRWGIVFLAFLGTAINYIDRANLSIAAPRIREDLGLDATAMGLILGAFFWTYAVFQLPSGWFVDRVGARLAYTIACAWWSVFTALTVFGRGMVSLFTFRLLLGVGEAPAYPCNAKVVSEWFPKSERAFATGIFDSGARAGGVLAFPLVTAIVASLGWKASFLITGGVGVVWALVWWLFYRHPTEHSWVSEAELAHIESDKPKPQEKSKDASAEKPIKWRDLFRYRAIWGMMLGFFCLNSVAYFFITWFPTYLIAERGFTMLNVGIYGMIPGLFAIVAQWAGGLVSDALVRRGTSLTKARKIPLVGGMMMSSCIALAVFAPNAGWALALLSLSFGSVTFAAASVWSLPADVAPSPKHVASIGGIQNFAANVAGICISVLVGVVYQHTGTFIVPLLIVGGLAVLGAVAYLVVLGEIAPLRVPEKMAL